MKGVGVNATFFDTKDVSVIFTRWEVIDPASELGMIDFEKGEVQGKRSGSNHKARCLKRITANSYVTWCSVGHPVTCFDAVRR